MFPRIERAGRPLITAAVLIIAAAVLLLGTVTLFAAALSVRTAKDDTVAEQASIITAIESELPDGRCAYIFRHKGTEYLVITGETDTAVLIRDSVELSDEHR